MSSGRLHMAVSALGDRGVWIFPGKGENPRNVGPALQDWLSRCAYRADHTSLARLELDPEERDWYDPAVAIADAILGG